MRGGEGRGDNRRKQEGGEDRREEEMEYEKADWDERK